MCNLTLPWGWGSNRRVYSVTLGTSGDFRDMVTSCGITFAPFRFSIRAMLEDPETRSAFVSKRAAFRLARRAGPMMPGLLDDAWTASHGAQAIVYHPKILNGLDIGEKLSVPSFVGFYLPISPTRAFPRRSCHCPRIGGVLLIVRATWFSCG